MALALVATSELGIEADLEIAGKQYSRAPALEAAVRLSLFTDARALDGDELPEGPNEFGTDRRGYWAQKYLRARAPFGSRLWLLKRSKLTQETRQLWRDYALEALQWMIELEIADRIEISTEVVGRNRLEATITIHRRNDTPARFAYLWEAF